MLPLKESRSPIASVPALNFCVKSLAITVIAVSIIGLLVGVFAYLSVTGKLSMPALNGLGTLGLHNSYLLMGGSAGLLAFAIVTLAFQVARSKY